MKFLILGGTLFLGRRIVEAAVARGHEVTLFNRGIHGRDLFPSLERIAGDRTLSLHPLEGRRWDAVVDTSGFTPSQVRASAEFLAGAVEHYTFISSIAAYADFQTIGIAESSPAAALSPEELSAAERVEVKGRVTSAAYGGWFGALKAMCEQAAEAALPGKTLIVRPGLIVGPHDPSGRFAYWVARVAKGGMVLAPGRPDRGIQLIDVGDLAEWIVGMVEAGGTGVYNATGPDGVSTMGRFLEECRRITGGGAEFVWVGEDFLLDNGVTPWVELPLWISERPDGAKYGFLSIDSSKAIGSGLRFRPLDRTIFDTFEWLSAGPAIPRDDQNRSIMSAAREAELLRLWSAAPGERRDGHETRNG